MEAKCFEIDKAMSQCLNIMKLLFIVMVVFIHSEASPEMVLHIPMYVQICKNIVSSGICGIAVPGFFFISGFLLFSKEFTWMGNLKKKAKSIILPYIAINLFWVIFFKGVHFFEFTKHYFAEEAYQIRGIEGFLRAFLDPMPLYYPFWFLRDLIILNIFAKIVQMIIDKIPWLSLIAIIALYFNIIQIPLLLSNSSFCIFFLSYYFVKYQTIIKKLDKIKGLYLGLIFVGLIVVKLWIWNHAIVNLIYTAIGLTFFYQLAGKIRKGPLCKPILWCSQFTFFIYAFHEFYEAMLKKIVMTVLPQYGFVQLIEFFLVPILMICICIAAGAMIKRWIPILYQLICGYR